MATNPTEASGGKKPTTSAAKGGHRRKQKQYLSERQQAEIRAGFDLFDVEGRGVVDNKSMFVAMRALGFEPRREDMKRIVQAVDPDETGSVDFHGFLAALTTRMIQKDTPEEIVKAFQLFDSEGDGVITLANLKRVASELGENMNDDEVREMMGASDADDNDTIDLHEFMRIVKKSFP